jgi:O-antigen ligase
MSWGGADLSNQYVSAAANAGLLAVYLFILLLVRCFRGLGKALAETREELPEAERLFWGLGCALFAHAVSLFSITYFDQLGVAWWGFLAIIAGSTSEVLEQKPVLLPVEAEESGAPGANLAQNF